MTSCISIKDAIITNDFENDNDPSNFSLNFSNGNKFQMLCSPGNKINDSQIIGELLGTEYKTKTGGFLKFKDLPNKKKDKHRLLWISEETHEIKKDISLLTVSYTHLTLPTTPYV